MIKEIGSVLIFQILSWKCLFNSSFNFIGSCEKCNSVLTTMKHQSLFSGAKLLSEVEYSEITRERSKPKLCKSYGLRACRLRMEVQENNEWPLQNNILKWQNKTVIEYGNTKTKNSKIKLKLKQWE